MTSNTLRKTLWFLLFLYLVAFPFGQFTRLPFPFLPTEVRIYVTDILVGMIGIAGVLFGGKKIFPFSRSMFVFMMAALFSLMLASAGLNASQTIISSLYLLRLFCYGLFFIAVWNLIKARKEKELVVNSTILVGIATAVFGWVQYLVFPDTRFLLAAGWDEHLNRIIGSFFDPNFTSIILVFTLLLFFGKLHLPGVHLMQRGSPGRWAWVLLLVVFSALLFTYSRSGYLAFLAGMVAYSIVLKNMRIVILGFGLLALGIYLLPKQTSEGTKLERTTSAILRIGNWNEGLEIFRRDPVFGLGFNTLRYTRHGLSEEKYGPSHAASGVDNSFLFVLVTTGIVGFIGFINLLATLIKVSWGSMGSRVIIIPTFAALFVHSMFVNSLFYPWVLGWLALLLAGTLRTVKD